MKNRSHLDLHQQLLRYVQQWESIRSLAYDVLDLVHKVIEAPSPEELAKLKDELQTLRSHLREESTRSVNHVGNSMDFKN